MVEIILLRARRSYQLTLTEAKTIAVDKSKRVTLPRWRSYCFISQPAFEMLNITYSCVTKTNYLGLGNSNPKSK